MTPFPSRDCPGDRREAVVSSSSSLKRGFTLIELLVLIAIITILAAILFPVFARAREKARQAQGLSNLRQLGTALRMYVDEHDGQMLQHAYGDTSRGRPGSYQWPHVLQPYLKNWEIFVCPNAPALNGISRFRGIDWATYQNDPAYPRDGRFIGYAVNLNYHQHSSDPNVTWHPLNKHEAVIEDLAGTVLIQEHTGSPWLAVWASNGPPTGGPYLPADTAWMTRPDAVTGARIARAADGVDLLFCDGHAKWMAPGAAFEKRDSSRGTVAYRYTIFQD